MFTGINELTRSYKPRLSVMKYKDGKTLTEADKISIQWAEYCGEMYDSPIRNLKPMEPNGEELLPLRDEVEWAIRQLPLRKSTGNDEISAETPEASGEEGIDIYHTFRKKIWKEEQWPEEWLKAVFVPISKKGDLQQFTNYRKIALISHASKILLKITM